FCEEIYYTAYPLLLNLRRRFKGWVPVLGTSALAAVVLLIFRKHDAEAMNFTGMGYGWTWLLGLPMWILGCVLAESCDALKKWDRPRPLIWAWRLGIWGASIVLLVLRFHRGLSYEFTLLPFGVLGFFWLKAEMSYAYAYPPAKSFEKAGGASYTVYLTHMLALGFLGLQASTTHRQAGPWALSMGVLIVFTVAFYS